VSSQPVEANVVLTADNSQYDTSMQQSAASTDKLSHSVDSLGTKINNITKSAGRKFLGIGAADVAIITAATAAWASYEKQMSRLQAQAAVITRTRDGENKVMKEYTSSVENLRKQYGSTTTAAAELTQQISKLSDQTRPIKDLAQTFEKMSMATGENATGLANSLLNLQKIMGTPQTQTKNYADQLTYLAAKSDTSATALAQFTSQIAPMGRAMGMSQTQVTGFSNMFIKAGQDGYSAATAFNKVTQDITTAVQTGNPDLHKYANLLGMTVGHFKNMSGAEQVAGFLDHIAQLGPKAAMTLNQFGFDGIRMAKAITGTVQASGGAMNAIREAQIGYGSDATDKGSEAAHTMSDTFAKLRQDMQMTAEAFGKAFGPGVDLVLRQIERLASGFNNLMEGPLGKFLQLAAAVVVPITAAAGAMLLLAGTITKVAAAFALIKGSPGLGLMEGLRGGSRIVPAVRGRCRATWPSVISG
jgi:TP901 family phage tail tape measure protein